MSLVHTPCPLCDGSAFALVHPGTIADLDSEAVPYFSSGRERVGYFNIVRCDQCSLVQMRPRDDDATLGRTYSALADSSYDAEDAQRARTALSHLGFVNRHQQRGKLLDVGCATGTFVRAAQADGWAVVGIDASSWSVERARERCPEATFVVWRVEDARFELGSFDAITLWDTLEHLPDPAATVRQIRKWLKPGGLLFLNVPNADSWVARILGRRWMLLLREHLWYFSPRTIAALIDQTGLACVETRSNFVRFSFAAILKRLAQYPSFPRRMAEYLAQTWLGRIMLRFPIGEMNVAAKRVEQLTALDS